MGHIIFLRHGQAKNNVERILAGRTEGVPLTDVGIKQAEHTAELLKHMNVSAIYSSPIERAKHTAEIVGGHNSLDVTIDDRLIELDMGKFTGVPYDEIFTSHGNVFMKFYNGELEIAHNGVETFAEVKKRVLGIVDHVIEKHPDENVVLVTHMDPIKAMLSTIVDLSPTNLFELIIENASLNLFREKDRKFSLSGLNVMHPSRFDLRI
ncbi:MAG: histidine phosphatase family protein [Nitrosopumilus sp.]|uniref:Histidine phosphatase family protein n=1 Tax=Nitrosopumilus zosterae TaxID=718286 RepID=A0A2S2KTZ7_9ARCH|nr:MULTISPECIES: histidine phosphatase family protein [Nitrosopumilus]MCV0366603.1 histidine phosphatase family protein [Nitrosopumilus sp.]BDQ31774.1 histidine phosphatase family protein [Nitrosopumilus zosterae]GBH35124.1 histidine phosphatase family protein [Nitrosopumilus zosterae]